ncbi:Uncharacterized protein HZ326_0907 [Fusarium oxysporum f. sp. albedinis]|nr:Uncharacterized protein HZ326_0907 [Fusarium oxysporum f. sp. albedinis]
MSSVNTQGTTGHLHIKTILVYHSGDRAETETIDRPKNWHRHARSRIDASVKLWRMSPKRTRPQQWPLAQSAGVSTASIQYHRIHAGKYEKTSQVC